VTQTDLQQLFAEINLTPSRKLGQNFLIDQNVSAWIARQLEVEKDDTVVEVGPGAGSLTREILERTENLVLVEMDGRLARFLTHHLRERPKVEIHNADACQFDARTLFPRQPVKLIGNLPYSAGGAIVKNFLGAHSPVTEAVLMLQREVAERICAKPRTKDFGVLTLRVQARWVPKILKHIGPECFFPRPQIDSTVMRMTPRSPGDLPVYDQRLFDSTIRRGFSQRRKQLRKCLNLESDKWKEIVEKLELNETARAEELSLEQWIDLTNLLDEHPLKDNPQSGDELFDVVDDNNQVTGQAPRAQVHAEGLKHRATHIFLFNPAGEIFLQKRSRLKDVHPGAWDSSAAGHLDAGEDYESAAAREIVEELGLEAELDFVTELPPSEANGQEFIHLFRATSKAKPKWPASEIEFGQFFPTEVVDDWIAARPQDFAGGFLECWAALKSDCP
tara:strand:+ start:503 stop:1843 length:1341 start_codon:yes stop_codon:yes gene_type:complete